MSYKFQVAGATLEGRTVPGAGYMRIHTQPDDSFFAGFIPIPDEATARIESGIWHQLAADTDLALLKNIQPQVIAACEKRLRYFRRLKAGSGKRIKTGIPAAGFDNNYFIGSEGLEGNIDGTA